MYFLLFSLFLAANAYGQTTVDSRPHLQVLERVQAILEEEREKNKIPGMAVALYINNQEYFLSYGFADTEKRTFIDPDTLFRLASIAKVFTSTVLSLKAIEGRVQLTDSVAKYLSIKDAPFLNTDFSKITLLNLATHTSSLPKSFPENKENPIQTEEQLINNLNQWKAGSPPGSKYFYSNLGFSILGIALARQNQTSYFDMLNSLILQPLKMNSTFVDIPDAFLYRVAIGYHDNKSVERVVRNRLSIASGGLYSSARDMLLFLKANLGVEGPKNLIVAMEYAQKEFFAVSNQLSMGLGWQRFTTKENLLIIDKNGGLPGFASYIGMTNQGKKIGIVILANKDGINSTAIGRRILSSIQKEERK